MTEDAMIMLFVLPMFLIGIPQTDMVVLAVFGNVLPFHLIAWAQQHIDS